MSVDNIDPKLVRSADSTFRAVSECLANLNSPVKKRLRRTPSDETGQDVFPTNLW